MEEKNLEKKNIIAIIPARSGSKGIPDKNIMSMHGKPMIAYSIEHALDSKLINRVIVSTDSDFYAEIAKKYGAEAPFIRPEEHAQDKTPDFPVFLHTINWLKENEDYEPDIIVHLRPTHPLRDVKDIDKMIEILINNPHLDSVRSIIESPETPFKMWFLKENNLLSSVVNTEIRDAHNLPRQVLPKTFLQTASIDVLRTKTLLEKRSMTGDNIHGYIINEIYDIDSIEDLEKALLNKSINLENKSFCIDIDGVIATLTPGNNYNQALPLKENIKIINILFNKKNEIILFTARGNKTGIDWEETTRNQLKDWGVKFHKLMFGKPASDYYIDDRSISIHHLKKNLKGG